ncbi:MAG: C39 family peptidase, partial [Clostridia bacterium]|nr:C39 family peptidase [Clostridia bacterium]
MPYLHTAKSNKKPHAGLRCAALILCALLLVSCGKIAGPGEESAGPASQDVTSAEASVAESLPEPVSEPEDESSEEPVREARMLDVPLICQFPSLPTGCEAVAATMLLNYYGITVDAETVAGEWLDCEPYYYKDGVMYAPDPEEKFVGDPFTSQSYGCFAPVIAKAINENCLAVRANPLHGLELEELLARVSRGDPVLIWATGQMMEPMQGALWTLPNGEKLQWKRGEHCLVLAGYDTNFVYLNDPDSGERVRYDKELVRTRYEQMGSWALEIKVSGDYLNGKHSIRYELGNTADLFTSTPSESIAGEKVEIKTTVLYDADIHVFVDKLAIEKTHYDSDYWGYSFIMPDRDVLVTAEVYSGDGFRGTGDPDLAVLRDTYPEYFGLDASKGLEVYVWEMARGCCMCGLLSGKDREKTLGELLNMRGASVEDMRAILSCYGVDEKYISVIPWQNPISSYIADYWIRRQDEDSASVEK